MWNLKSWRLVRVAEPTVRCLSKLLHNPERSRWWFWRWWASRWWWRWQQFRLWLVVRMSKPTVWSCLSCSTTLNDHYQDDFCVGEDAFCSSHSHSQIHSKLTFCDLRYLIFSIVDEYLLWLSTTISARSVWSETYLSLFIKLNLQSSLIQPW